MQTSWSRQTRWNGIARRLLPSLPAHDLLRDRAYRRLWTSILISSFGGQVTMLALPLTAAILLHATPTQMGLLSAVEILPFVLLSLPAGVWLDRVRKLPVYIAGELTIALVVLSVPVAWWLGWLSIRWLYACGFVLGSVYTVAGSAAQIVLTQVVPRERLVEAHAKNALASSGAEVAGPGLAGALIKVVGAPLALLVDAVLVTVSAAILRGVVIHEAPANVRAAGARGRRFWADLKAGVRFVARHRLLVALALAVGTWQACHQAAIVVQILFATRTLGLSEQAIGLSYTGMGIGTVIASVFGNRISRTIGPGPCLILGFAVCGAGWLLLAIAPANDWGVAAFAVMLTMFSTGAVFIFINFLALRQAVTPAPLLGRMTSTMRWLILIPAGPGALLGGWLGEHVGLRASLAVAGAGSLLLAAAAWQLGVIRRVRELPAAEHVDEWLGAEADVGTRIVVT
ncbi:MAG TPA: MFS transporter [Caldimonas sp.]|nr:MFS transporter [Caldimonas sp.]HEX4234867.1 MFS transporter [Caldimonas sp.]